MSVQSVGLQVRINGVMTTVPLFADPVTIERGMRPYGEDWPSPTMFTCTINNDTLDYDPSRPASLLYGVAGRNTESRIRPAGSSRVYAEATRWEPRETVDHVPGVQRGRAEVALTAYGISQRLTTWTESLKSPMFKTIAARSTSIGHWPCEEERDATQLSNTLVGGRPGVATLITFGEDDAPSGAARSVAAADGSNLAGRFVSSSTSSGWQVFWSFRFPTLPSSGTYALMFRVNCVNGYVYYFDINNTSYRMNVHDASGTNIASELYFYGQGAEPNKWITMRIAAEQSGGNVAWAWSWYAQDMDVYFIPSGTFAGVVSAPRDWRQAGNATTAGSHWCHVGGVTTLADDLMSLTSRRAFNGYRGETAMARYLRLMSEAGLARFIIGSSADSIPMGPQRPSTLVDALAECRATEDADISDERFQIGLTGRVRREQYDMAPALELVYGSHIAAKTKLVGADGVWNRVTVANASGGEYTLTRTDGLMSVAAPPDGIGEVRRQIDVSVSDERLYLPLLAQWHLAKGTLEGARYSSIVVNLNRHPELVADVVAVREGDMITVEGLEPDLVRLLVVGMVERITAASWDYEFRVEPYDTYMVGVWDDPAFIWGTNLSRLDGAHTAGETTLALTTDSPYGVWSTAFTGDLMIEGERVSVTSMGAASGSGPYTQTATVDRAVNGVSKALADDAKVMLFDGRRWGL